MTEDEKVDRAWFEVTYYTMCRNMDFYERNILRCELRKQDRETTQRKKKEEEEEQMRAFTS